VLGPLTVRNLKEGELAKTPESQEYIPNLQIPQPCLHPSVDHHPPADCRNALVELEAIQKHKSRINNPRLAAIRSVALGLRESLFACLRAARTDSRFYAILFRSMNHA